MDLVVIEDNNYMKTMNENINWMKIAHLLSFILQELSNSFYTSTPALTFSIAILVPMQ